MPGCASEKKSRRGKMCSSLLSDAFGIRNLFFYYFSCRYSALWVSFIWSSILSYCPGKEVREWWNVQFFVLSISSAIHLDLKQTTAQAAVVQHEPSYNKFTGTWQRRLFFSESCSALLLL